MKLLYLDTSALFKRYVEEDESEEVLERIEEAPVVGTALITQVEVAAALAQAVRQQRMGRNEAQEAEQEFLDDWDDFTRIGVTGGLATRANEGTRRTSATPPTEHAGQGKANTNRLFPRLGRSSGASAVKVPDVPE